MRSKSSKWPYRDSLFFSEQLKEELRKPLGRLYEGDVDTSSRKAVEDIMDRKVGMVITVGDITTKMFIAHGAKPKVVVIDNKFERQDLHDKIALSTFKVVKTRNPAGEISPESADAVFAAITDEQKVAVVVNGEEDLLALPAILACEEGGAVAYGQPKAGCVVVFVDKHSKGKVIEILEKASSR